MERFVIDRREALAQLSYVCLAVASGVAFSRRSNAGTNPSTIDGLAGLLADRASVVFVGAVFLKTYPEEAGLDTLVERLGLEMKSLPAAGSVELETTARSIHALHIDDFRNGRLIEIAGWNLSLTELRLAALTYRAQQD